MKTTIPFFSKVLFREIIRSPRVFENVKLKFDRTFSASKDSNWKVEKISQHNGAKFRKWSRKLFFLKSCDSTYLDLKNYWHNFLHFLCILTPWLVLLFTRVWKDFYTYNLRKMMKRQKQRYFGAFLEVLIFQNFFWLKVSNKARVCLKKIQKSIRWIFCNILQLLSHNDVTFWKDMIFLKNLYVSTF